MGTFDDANVDKDLLSQIFADEGDDSETASLLDEMIKDVEKDNAEEKEIEIPSVEDMVEENEVEMPSVDDMVGENEVEMPSVDDMVEENEVEMPSVDDMVGENEVEMPSVDDMVGENEVEMPSVDDMVEENKIEIPTVDDNTAEKEIEISAANDVSTTEIPNVEMGNSEPEIPAQKPDFETNTENDSVRKEAKEAMDQARANGTVTTITSGTIIKGGIISDSSLEVMGVITGDVECQGKVSIFGSVSGNVIASELYLSTKRLEGSLSSEGAVKVGVGTIIVGDIEGTSAYIAGAVKGDIDINGHVIIDSTAIIKGNIKAKSIQVNNGAVVDGYCSLNYAGVDLEGFFEED